MPKVVLILGEADGGFCYHPPLCDDSEATMPKVLVRAGAVPL
jgi:hypothetical protein